MHMQGPFLESPHNFTGPELFKVRMYRMAKYVLALKAARLVSSTYNVIA